MKKWITILSIFASFLTSAQNNALFENATTAYNKGDYEAAIQNYLEILENGEHSANLYFNLGNTYYKLNKIGPSIYYYEKALLLKPNDSDIKHNLTFAQNMTIDVIEPLPQTSISKIVAGFKNILSYDQWSYMAVFCVFLFVAFYLAFYFFRFTNQKRISFIISLFFLSFSVISVLMAVVQSRDFKATQPAIVFAEESRIKAEPNTRSEEVFILHEGSKVAVEDRLEDWVKIRLADGKTGWIQSLDLKMLKDF